MAYFDRHPRAFRVLFGAFAAYLFLLGAVSIYNLGKSPTDENIFSDPPSWAYVSNNIPAELFDDDEARFGSDSIRVGDLLLSVNSKQFSTLQEATSYLSSLSDTSLLEIQLFRPTDGTKHMYQVVKALFAPNRVRELQPTAMVTDVSPRGASDRAGMQVGDLIMSINGKTFKNVREADGILRQGQIGKTIDYEVLRSNEILTLHVTLASFGFQFAFIALMLVGLVYMATGVYLGQVRPQFAAARLLGMFFISVGFLVAIAFVNRGPDSPALFASRTWTLRICLFTAMAVFLHSLHYFPKERPDLLRRKWIRRSGYILGAIGLVVIGALPTVWPNVLVVGTLLYVTSVPLFFRRERSVEYRKMNRLVMWTGIGVGATSAAFVLAARGMGPASISLVGWFAATLLVVPAAYLYTIGRYRLLNLAFRIRRSIQYSFVSIAWLVLLLLTLMAAISWLVQTDLRMPYIRITGTSIEIVDTPTSLREQTLLEKGVLAGCAIGVALTGLRLHRAGAHFISQKFHRTKYDYRRAASELASVISSTLSMSDLAKGIVEKLANLMQLKQVGLLFFREQEVCCCQQAHGFDGQSWSSFCVTIDQSIIDQLKPFTNEMRVEYFPAALREKFRTPEFHYVIPIRSKEKLVGIILMGEKMSESAYTPEDLEFLGAVAKQASVAVENAFLYEELAEQERLKHELAIARKIQLESLPQSTPRLPGLEISGISVPAMEVGGDYFDYLDGDPMKLTVIIGDVSGKGTSAALYMSKVQGILRSLHAFGLSPRQLFIRANHLLCNDLEKKSFVTAMGGAFDTSKRELVLSRAGHLPLYHYKANKTGIEKLVPRGLGLGLSPENLFADELEERRISYSPGDIFVFVTDGITEGQRETGDEFGDERLMSILEENQAASPEVIRDSVIAGVKKFAGTAAQHDDQTIVVVKATS